MATVGGSPVTSAKLTELGKALNQTSISNVDNGVLSPLTTGKASSDAFNEMEDEHDYNNNEEEDQTNDGQVVSTQTMKRSAKSPKKRGRTDSLKKMLPAPASQRHKQVLQFLQSPLQRSSGTEEESVASPSVDTLHETSSQLQRTQGQPAKLMVKDRRGSGMGVPRAHLILNAVKQAPPAKEKSNPRRWSKHEDESLRLAVERSGERNWKAIADQVPGRNHTQCLQRWTKVLKPGLIKGHWTPEEDAKLRELVAEGKKNWGQVASLIPGRTSKQCRERWCNHLDPNINKGSYTEDEDKIIVEMQAKLGNRWSIIAQQLKGRTEDAVKIRWKSLMRGRRAASKEEKSSAVSTTLLAADTAAITSMPSRADKERPKMKDLKGSFARQSSRALAMANTTVKTEHDVVAENKVLADPTPTVDNEGNSAENVPDTAFVKSMQALAPASQPDITTVMSGTTNSMQVNDLVAASIYNFQMSQRFHPSSIAHANTAMYPVSNKLMSTVASGNRQSPGVYSMGDGGMGAYNMTMQPQQHLLQQHTEHQQLLPSYQYPPGYTMQQNVGVMLNYGMPTNLSTSNRMQYSMPVSSSMQLMPSAPTYSSQAAAMAIANAQYQQHSQHPPIVHQGFSGAPLHPRVVSTGTLVGTSTQPTMPATSNGLTANSGSSNGSEVNGNSVANAGLPPSSAAVAKGKGLNTPREEWGSSQTPRSQMIMTEGHASAYELFHQQRLRLMLQERDKQGMTLCSAPSPGQALLTKELEANKERQARQAIMQKGWKSAVESMIPYNSVSDLSTLDDQQRYDGLLEKVSLSALDPTDDGLLDETVDIVSGDDTVDL
ncbi:unnamed protein product [Peronospora belbahrii]|uniref:Uncharacterized protein n=1 Tax=Peronospora belbahrii TaxID=622444 RepID=A0ABN8CST0_9STRA|nr:unnamed protein product [Peronospora belbahrii]